MHPRRAQRGFFLVDFLFTGAWYSLAFKWLMIAAIAYLGFRVGPVYREAANALEAVRTVAVTSRDISAAELKERVGKAFEARKLEIDPKREVTVREKENSIAIAVQYERRVPLFGTKNSNVGLVVNFNFTNTSLPSAIFAAE